MSEPKRSSWKWWLLAGYVVALIAHHAVDRFGPVAPTLVEAPASILRLDDGRDVVFTDRGEGPSVVFLHDVPGDAREFDALLENAPWRAITIDFPGFGRSRTAVGDPSSAAAARAVLAVLDSLDVTDAHFVALGQGGAVMVEVLGARASAVRSVALIGAAGVEEFELLGKYEINQPLYAAQLAIVWLLDVAVPHFGAFDRLPLNVNVARFFHSGDSRPARERFEALDAPVLIVHGRDDFLVPPEVAQEHARILPQARTVMVEGVGHGIVRDESARVAVELRRWISELESGRAVTRADATPDRRERAAIPIEEIRDFHAHGVTLWLLLILIVFATFVSEDATCIGVGLLIAQGRVGWLEGFGAVFVGIYFGDLILYGVGHALGMTVVKWIPFRWFLNERDLRRGADFFGKKGLFAIFLTRFLPGSRLPTYLAIGIMRAGFWKFASFFFVAVMLWTPFLVGFAALVGQEALAKFERLQQESLVVFAIVAAVLFVIVKVLLPLVRWRGRRLAVARWTRWRRWEYWPAWIVYLPIVIKAFGWARRYGGFTLPTAVNWGMDGAGGLVGESKHAILRAFGDDPHVARSLFLPADAMEERALAAEEFIAIEGFPVVLKPDVGQRGEGVHVVRSRERLHELLEEQDVDLLLQEYVEGFEFGIFYERDVDEAHGRITSLAEKRPLTVTGDGESTLERLILADERAVALGERHLRRHAERLDWVPAAGEVAVLVEIGTHSRGATFVDARSLITPALEAAVDALSRRYDGFHLGRYDVRVSSHEALAAGRDFKVLELNGLTAEPAHIYDPSAGLDDARAALARQWEDAYRIGAAQRARGHRAHSLRAILAEWFAHRQRRRRHAPERATDPIGGFGAVSGESTDAP